jgi:excisionase family DNA binding protein
MNALPKLHTINATAALLRVSRNTVYRFAREGKLVRIQIGENSSRITEESIRSLVDGGKVASMVATGC